MNTEKTGPVFLPRGSCLWLLSLALLSAAGGCSAGRGGGTSDFMKAVNSIRPGTPQADVLEQLGQPDERSRGRVEALPASGPAEGLTAVVPVGTRYEHWIYKRRDSLYHVFFVPSARDAGGWEVAEVRSSPDLGS